MTRKERILQTCTENTLLIRSAFKKYSLLNGEG
jgi:hypothetical protein